LKYFSQLNIQVWIDTTLTTQNFITKETVRFEGFMVVKIQVEVFWVMMLRGVMVGYQHFRGSCCLHLQGEVKVASP
jgi:hypothetical protein